MDTWRLRLHTEARLRNQGNKCAICDWEFTDPEVEATRIYTAANSQRLQDMMVVCEVCKAVVGVRAFGLETRAKTRELIVARYAKVCQGNVSTSNDNVAVTKDGKVIDKLPTWEELEAEAAKSAPPTIANVKSAADSERRLDELMQQWKQQAK